MKLREIELALTTKIVKRLQHELFNGRMWINRKIGLPAQTIKEIRLFKKIFTEMAQHKKQIRIFEWGSGYSTMYYANYLREIKADFQWHAIDNNPDWHSIVRKMISDNQLDSSVHLHIKSFSPFWEKPEWGPIPPPCGKFTPQTEDEISYVNFPMTLGADFDIIIIDARFRRCCLKIAMNVLSDVGIVIMHDAQKTHYHTGIEKFPYRKFFDTGTWYPFQKPENRMWVGAIKNQNCVDGL